MDRSSRLTVLVAVLTLILSSCCHAENTVFYRPLRVGANVTVALPCWELIDASHLIIWITPAEVVIGPDYHDVSGKYTIDFEGSLLVNDTEKNDTGIYKCISRSPDGPYTTTKTELEVIDASYLPEVDEWQKNLARGLIAAASTAALFISACGFYHFNWEERHPQGKSKRSSISSGSHPSSATSSDTPNLHELKGLDNPALTIDTNEIDSGLEILEDESGWMRPFESYRRQPRTISMASAVSDSVNEGSPQMNISVETAESVYLILSSAWRAGRTQWPQTAAEKAAEKNEYYKAYDPLTGLKIAATLSGFLTMAVLYVFYKAKCKRLKFMRSSSDEDSIVIDQPASQPHLHESNPGLTADSSAFYQVEVECGSANKFQHYCESGRETPSGSIVTSQQPALHQSTVTIKSSQPQYYADDSEMPAWKIYAKELFLYGGSGLWRSASLQKGSDPVLLVAQSSFDETINSRSQRTGSLSGSVMGGLGIYRCDSRKPSSVCAYPTRNSQSRLQVPNVQPKTACVSQLHRQRSLNRQDCSRQDEVITGSGRDQQLQSPFNKKNLPGRSVSFRESDMTNYSRSKRVARSRPGSLHNNRPDYSRLRSGSCSNAETGHLRPDTLAVGHRRSSFRTPSRQPSIRENRRHAVTPSTSVDLPIPSLPPPSPRSRLAVVHRVHIQQPEDSKNKSTYCRSASLTSEPISRGWRSSIAKMIRAKSTSGHSVRSNGERTECSSPKNRRNRNPSSLANAEMGLAPSTKQEERDNGNSQREGHIDICVIQATPAASPCTSIRSTFSGDSLDSATAKNIPAFSSFQPSAVMSVRDRRKCFARMKGQTIDHDNALAIDTSFLAPPMVEYNVGLSPSSLLSYPLADLRSHRSTSPAGHSASTWLQVFNEEPHPLKDNCHPPTKRPAAVSTGNKSRSSALTGEHLGVGQLPSSAEVVKGGRPAGQQVSNSSPTYPNTQQQSTPFPF